MVFSSWGGGALAESSDAWAQFALLAPVQAVAEERSVTNLRLSLLHGANQDVRGFDFSGIATETRGSFRGGLQIALVNYVAGACSGAQISVMGNDVRGRLRGVQFSVLSSRAGEGSGMQVGLIRSTSREFKGFQLALFTWAKEMEGLQIGVLNFNEKGILPVFPIFNFGR
jgi:hypothetical protein